MSEDEPNYIEVYLDTISVNHPEPYHVRLGFEGNYIFEWQNYKHEVIEEDVYVSPEGDNNNSGTSAEEPFKNLHIAVNRIYPTEANPLTVYMAAGHYSQSTNGDIFPLSFRDNFNLVGAGREDTILDAEYDSEVIASFSLTYGFTNNSSMDGFTITGGLRPGPSGGAVSISGPRNVLLSNLKFLDNKSIFAYSALTLSNFRATPADSCNMIMKDIIFDGNLGNTVIESQNCDIYAENIIIRNSGSNMDAPNDFGGWGRFCIGSKFLGYSNFEEKCEITFVNSHFYNNNSFASNGAGVITMGSFARHLNVNFINCTFADNTAEPYGPSIFIFEDDVKLNLQNCIFSNNNENAISVGIDGIETNSITAHNSIFEDIDFGFWDEWSDELFVFDTTNVMYGDPLFEEDEVNPHRLSADSPCIDSGEIPQDFAMPFYDLAGNERIMGYGIDMGCFESDFTDAEDDEIFEITGYALTNYPNPFNPTTTISFTLNTEITESTEMEIYNIKGQKIKSIFVSFDSAQDDKQSVTWNGTDKHNKPVSSGVYFATLKSENKVLASRKMLLMK